MAPDNAFHSLSIPAAAARIRDAIGVKRGHTDEIFQRRHVVAVGIGFRNRDRQGLKELCIVCCVDYKRRLNELAERDRIPQYFGDFRTDVIATGRFQSLARLSNGQQIQRMRPVRPGLSIGHPETTAGTFGCVVERNGEKLLLSNNHVIANGNRARLGSPILQPGPHDGGSLNRDAFARLVEYVPIVYDGEADLYPMPEYDPEPIPTPAPPASPQPPQGCGRAIPFRSAARSAVSGINRAGANKVDCALARPDDPSMITTEILGLGSPRGVGIGALGMLVRKSGRTTGLTQGQIEQIDVTSRVDYGDRAATFSGQLLASAVSSGGDSGSVVLDMAGNVVGLLFAGSSTSTLINPIQDVLRALNVSIV